MKTEQQQNARDLYLQTDKTQAEIAEILNVDRKTVYLWCKKGRWEEMKIAARQMPRAILHDIYNHIEQVNKRIREREDKCPKMKEIEKLRKLTNMTKLFVNKHIGSYIEVFEELTHFIAGRDYELCKKVTQYADQYVQGTFGDDENFYVDKRVAENVSTVITNLAKQKKAEEQEEKTKQQTEGTPGSEPGSSSNVSGMQRMRVCNAPLINPLSSSNVSRMQWIRVCNAPLINQPNNTSGPLPPAEKYTITTEVGQNGAFLQTQQNEDNPLTDNDSEAAPDTTKCPISDEKEIKDSGVISTDTPKSAPEIVEENTAAYYATLPPAQRPAPFREGNIIWINHPKDLDDYEHRMRMSDIVRYYPDMDPSLRWNRL